MQRFKVLNGGNSVFLHYEAEMSQAQAERSLQQPAGIQYQEAADFLTVQDKSMHKFNNSVSYSLIYTHNQHWATT